MQGKLSCLCLVFLAILTGCHQAAEPPVPTGTNLVAVVGAIHGQHERSNRYSLDILRDAVRRYDPEVVLVELPPDRFEAASKNFARHGEVREDRADDFPELTKVVFPLRDKMGFTMIPVAAWSQEVADNRRAVFKTIENDPARAGNLAKYQSAISKYNETVAGKSDDPEFIHGTAYDEAVKARQETYERLFGDDLGEGGWAKINDAHLALMNGALDDLKGQEKRVLILFGAWHKYKMLEGMEARTDVSIFDASQLF